MSKRKIIGLSVFVLVTSFFLEIPLVSEASDYPSRPIEIVVPFAPGGLPETIIRPFPGRLQKIFGQPVVVVFKPGAGGAAGSAFVARAKPDGYTLLVGSTSPLVLVPLTSKKDLGYTLEDFTYVCNLTVTPSVWLVKEDSPYKTLKDLIQAARTKKIKYSTPGTNTILHICMEALGKAAEFKAIHIPYSGGNPALAAVLGGHADVGITPGSLGMAGPGKLRAIGVALEKRSPLLPDVTSLGELGYHIDGSTYCGLEAPKGTPKEIVEKVYEAIKKVFDENAKELNDYYTRYEMTIHLLDPQGMEGLYKAEYKLRKKMIEETGILHE